MAFEQQFLFDGANIQVRKRIYQLTGSMFLGQGYDGEVYQISPNEVVKLYKEASSADSVKDKLSILCQKASSFHASVVAPKDFVFLTDGGTAHLRGFSMPFVSNGVGLDNYIWNPSVTEDDEALFDQTVADILYDLCGALRAIHRSRVIVGDLKPANILVSNGMAFIIDFDSASMPDYPAIFFTLEYLDPRLKGGVSKAEGPFPFDEESDWWALGVIAFQMFFGILPWQGVNPRIRDRNERIFNYSVVGLDPAVTPPKNKMRSLDWFDSKPKLRNYFEKLFSPDVSARYPIDYVLDRSFPRKGASERYNYQVRNINFGPVLDDFTRPVIDEIRQRGRTSVNKRSGESDFLRYMLGIVT